MAARPNARPRPATESPRRGRGTVESPRQPPSAQLAATAGSAVVSAARVGRLLGRTGWRLARQLPGMGLVEQQAQRIGQAAGGELRRLLETQQQFAGATSPEEQRVMMLVQNAATDPAPLRTAMSELLSRAGDAGDATSRDYLFGTIVSQLVPDEARVLAALANGNRHAVVDVVAKQFGRSATRTVLANASLLGAVADVSPARNVATYLTRLHGLGLIEFGPPADELSGEYDRLAADGVVQEARIAVERGRMGGAKLVRKSVTLSPLGREFWAASAPRG